MPLPFLFPLRYLFIYFKAAPFLERIERKQTCSCKVLQSLSDSAYVTDLKGMWLAVSRFSSFVHAKTEIFFFFFFSARQSLLFFFFFLSLSSQSLSVDTEKILRCLIILLFGRKNQANSQRGLTDLSQIFSLQGSDSRL